MAPRHPTCGSARSAGAVRRAGTALLALGTLLAAAACGPATDAGDRDAPGDRHPDRTARHSSGAGSPVPRERRPEAPSGLRAEATGPSAVTLRWRAPRGGPVAGYEVYRRGTESPVVLLGPELLEAEVSGLEPDTAHVFTVRAVDSGGRQSRASAPVRATTHAGEAGPGGRSTGTPEGGEPPGQDGSRAPTAESTAERRVEQVRHP